MYMEFGRSGKDYKISYNEETKNISYEIIQTVKSEMNIEEFFKHMILTGNSDIVKEIRNEIL